jgi:hypothetical protein
MKQASVQEHGGHERDRRSNAPDGGKIGMKEPGRHERVSGQKGLACPAVQQQLMNEYPAVQDNKKDGYQGEPYGRICVSDRNQAGTSSLAAGRAAIIDQKYLKNLDLSMKCGNTFDRAGGNATH